MATIHQSAKSGNLNRVKALLNQGVPVNSRTTGGITPLHFAASAGRLNVVQELLRRGARVNPRSHHVGVTPLHSAAYSGHPRVVHALIQAGANPKYRHISGGTPYNASSRHTTRNALKTSRAFAKWLTAVRKRRAERMLLSPRLLGSTPLTKNTIRSIARFVTVKKKSP